MELKALLRTNTFLYTVLMKGHQGHNSMNLIFLTPNITKVTVTWTKEMKNLRQMHLIPVASHDLSSAMVIVYIKSTSRLSVE